MEQAENLLGMVCAMFNPINSVLEQIIRNIPSNLYLIITIIYPVNTTLLLLQQGNENKIKSLDPDHFQS